MSRLENWVSHNLTVLKLFQYTMGFGMLFWAWYVYDGDFFHRSPAYDAMETIANENTWAVIAACLGGLRVIGTALNGGYPASIFIRLFCGAAGAGFWMAIAISFELASPGVGSAQPTYQIMFFIEVIIAGWAVNDWHRRNQ